MKGKRLKILAIVSIYAISLFAVVWIRVETLKSGYKLKELENELRHLQINLAEAEWKLGQITETKNIWVHGKTMGFLMPGEYPLNKIRHRNK